MVVDLMLIVVFGGFLASTIFAHLKAPPQAPAADMTAKKPKSTIPTSDTPRSPEPGGESPKPDAPAPAPEPKEEAKAAIMPASGSERTEADKALSSASRAPGADSKGRKEEAKEPAKKAPQTPAKEETAKPLPKPSLLAAPPAARPAPKAQNADTKEMKTPTPPAAKPAAKKEAVASPAADNAKIKAAPVEFKVSAPSAKSVALAGAFLVKGGKKDMLEESGGHWALTIYLKPGTYRYHFIIDGKKTLDSDNPRIERGSSVLVVP